MGRRPRPRYEGVIAPARPAATVALVSSKPPRAGPPTLVLERFPEAPHEPDFVADAPLVGFDAFLPEHRVYGWIRLAADRLTDILNANPELLLVNVQLERLEDGHVEWREELRLSRDGLLAVRAGGPRGDPARRQPRRLHPIVVQAGPYLIGGNIHAHHGVAPLEEIEGRPPMVPLSTAWLEHWADGRRHRQWAGTILFNRTLVDAVELVRDADLEFGATTWPIHAGSRTGPAQVDREPWADEPGVATA